MPAVSEVFAQDIAIVKEAVHTKLWRPGLEQHQKWVDLLNKLSELHGIPVPKLTVDASTAQPVRIPGHIFLDKYSLISLLHLFAKETGMQHLEAVMYSEGVYAEAYPAGAARLVRDPRTGFLVKRDSPALPEGGIPELN